MQRDLNRMLLRKRRRQRVWALLALTAFIALSVVTMRACSEQFEGPYNKDYRPLDIQRQSMERSP